jgi:hypothetical protein
MCAACALCGCVSVEGREGERKEDEWGGGEVCLLAGVEFTSYFFKDQTLTNTPTPPPHTGQIKCAVSWASSSGRQGRGLAASTAVIISQARGTFAATCPPSLPPSLHDDKTTPRPAGTAAAIAGGVAARRLGCHQWFHFPLVKSTPTLPPFPLALPPLPPSYHYPPYRNPHPY